MASAFSSWETDPFFAAAEDVQQSADRMESAYRNWIHKRVLAEETSAQQRNTNLCNDDVATALDTTKWQLDEFTKAVTKSDKFLLGEDASKRHFSFIEAIQNQIILIEDALHKCQFPNSSHSVKLNGEERDQLEMFLSGSAYSLATDQLAHEVKQHNSSLASSKTHVPISKMKRPFAMGLMCNHRDAQGFGTSSSSNECFADVCEPQHLNACLEIVEAGTEPVEELIGTQILQDSKVSSGHTNFIPTVHSVQPENAVGDSLAKVNRVKKPPSCKNGFRRWKNGNLHIDIKKDTTLWCKDKPQPDIEPGYFPKDSRSHGRNYLRSAGIWRLQRLLVVCNSFAQRASFVIVLLCLCSIYFWFLSSLVPHMNTVFPHSF